MNARVVTLKAISRRRLWPALVTFGAVVAGALGYILVTPPQYEATTRILINGRQASVSELGRDLTESPVVSGASAIATQVELAQSKKVLGFALERAGQERLAPLPDLLSLKNDIKVSILPATGILEITYRNTRPEVASGLVNLVAEAMVEDSLQSIRSEASSMRRYLEKEIPKRQALLRRAEATEKLYRQTNQLVSDGQTSLSVGSLNNLTDQQRALQAQLQELQTREDTLLKLTKTDSVDSAFRKLYVGQDPELRQLKTKLFDLETVLVDKRAQLGENHPDLLAALEKREAVQNLYSNRLKQLLHNEKSENKDEPFVDSLNGDLLSKLVMTQIERTATQKRLAVQSGQLVDLEKRLSQMPARQLTLVGLVREREEMAGSLALLQRKEDEARIAEAQVVSKITLIDPAELPVRPKWPNKASVLLLAIAGGSVLAIGMVVLLEALDDTLRSESEVKTLLPLPVLGVLPVLPKPTLQMADAAGFLAESSLMETYRMLLRSLDFRALAPPRVIVISSCTSGEGKSLVAAHLAAVSAFLSQRTLLIDADLRGSSQHETFSLSASPGLGDVMVGKASLTQAIRETGVKGLAVLTAGNVVVQPSLLLESPEMGRLIEQLAPHFDRIIIDTPPVSLCADAAVLCRHSDGMLLIARPDFTLREMLSRTVRELLDNRVTLLGIAINGVAGQVERYERESVRYSRQLPSASIEKENHEN